jgi:hypothetical protein
VKTSYEVRLGMIRDERVTKHREPENTSPRLSFTKMLHRVLDRQSVNLSFDTVRYLVFS